MYEDEIFYSWIALCMHVLKLPFCLLYIQKCINKFWAAAISGRKQLDPSLERVYEYSSSVLYFAG